MAPFYEIVVWFTNLSFNRASKASILLTYYVLRIASSFLISRYSPFSYTSTILFLVTLWHCSSAWNLEVVHLTLTKLSPFHEVRKSNTLPDMLHGGDLSTLSNDWMTMSALTIFYTASTLHTPMHSWQSVQCQSVVCNPQNPAFLPAEWTAENNASSWTTPTGPTVVFPPPRNLHMCIKKIIRNK